MKNIFKDIVQSIFSYPRAVVFSIRMWRYVLLLLAFISMFIIPIYIIGSTTQYLSNLIPYINGEKYANIGISFISSISGFILLVILSPIFSLLAGSVDQKLTGSNPPFSIVQFGTDILRAIKITFRNLFYQYLLLSIIYFGLSNIGESIVFFTIGNVLVFIVTAYFFGYTLLDYAMEIKQMNYKTSVQFVRSNIGLAIGLGSIYYIMITINDLTFIKDYLKNINLYWSVFSEAIVAFVGVIAAVLLMNQRDI